MTFVDHCFFVVPRLLNVSVPEEEKTAILHYQSFLYGRQTELVLCETSYCSHARPAGCVGRT